MDHVIAKLRANVVLVWTIIHAVTFQAVWIVNITMPTGFAVVATSMACAIYFYCLFDLGWSKNGIQKAALWLVLVTLIGLAVETLFFKFGVLRLDSESVPRLGSVPYWLLLIWVAFACAFYFCFKFLLERLWAAPLVGAFAFLSYLGGATLSPSVELGYDVVLSCAAIGAVWAIIMPGLLLLLRQMGLDKAC